jgi:hypothetical protein
MALSELKSDPGNARRHNKRNKDAIRASLERFGQVEPLIVCAGSLTVIGGNGRLSVMRELGWERAQCALMKLSTRERQALALALNRTGELARWDTAKLSEALAGIGDLAMDCGFSDQDLMDLEMAGQEMHGDFQDFIMDHTTEREAVKKPLDEGENSEGNGDHDGSGDEWYTPPEIIDAVSSALGGAIDLDPCWAPNSQVRAGATYDIRKGQDGTKLPWDKDRIFCNPPYSNVGPFFAKGREAADAGSNVVFLVPIRPETKAWQASIWSGPAWVVCQPGRIKFWDMHGRPHDGTMPVTTVFICMGPKSEKVAESIAVQLGGWILEGRKPGAQ